MRRGGKPMKKRDHGLNLDEESYLCGHCDNDAPLSVISSGLRQNEQREAPRPSETEVQGPDDGNTWLVAECQRCRGINVIQIYWVLAEGILSEEERDYVTTYNVQLGDDKVEVI